MTAMSLATLRADGMLAVLGLLLLLLVMLIVTIIRQPRWVPGPTEEDGTSEPGQPDPAPLRGMLPAAAEASQPAPPAAPAATGYPARHLRYPEPASAWGSGARITGGPPWGPAPRPPARPRSQ